MPRVVTCILECEGKILLLKRSKKVGTYKGLWGGVAGFVEEHEEPYETALKEIKEEVGVSNDKVRLIKTGDLIEFTDRYEGKTYHWTIYSFLFHLEEKDLIRLDWEHTKYQWIHPEKIEQFETVPHLQYAVSKLLEGKCRMGKYGGVVRRREKNNDNSPSSN